MQALILTLILTGSALMVANIVFYILFITKMNDVVSGGRKKDQVLLFTGLTLLVFFLIGYLIIGFSKPDDLVMALVLFFGSVFVTIMLVLTKTLISTAKERSLQIAQVLIDVVDARDPNLHGHSRHVQNLTMCLYRHLPKQLKSKINPTSLEYASLMHDVGKLGVPESILNKPGKLDEEEWKVMKNHPKIGVHFLNRVSSFQKISDWVLYHHERADGKGYYGAAPEITPLAAKIIAVCDTYSAITMKRSYKEARSHEEAIAIIKEAAGTQLDPTIVDIFTSIPKEELLSCTPEGLGVL